MLNSDIFRMIDYVQFVRAHLFLKSDGSQERGVSYQAHTPIKTATGSSVLGVPTEHHGLSPINRTALNYATKWAQKHTKAIEFAYARSSQAQTLLPQVIRLISRPFDSLAQLNISTTFWALSHILGAPEERPEALTAERMNQLLGGSIHPFRLRNIVVMSETDIPARSPDQDATDWIISCTQRLGADEYYHGGTAAAAYLDEERLEKAGITAVQQLWVCQPYRQLYQRVGFLPNLSILDLLMNEDIRRVQEVLRGTKDTV